MKLEKLESTGLGQRYALCSAMRVGLEVTLAALQRVAGGERKDEEIAISDPAQFAVVREALGNGGLKARLDGDGVSYQETRLAGVWLSEFGSGGVVHLGGYPAPIQRGLERWRTLGLETRGLDTARRKQIKQLKTAIRRYVRNGTTSVINLRQEEAQKRYDRDILQWLVSGEVELRGGLCGDFVAQTTRLPFLWYVNYMNSSGDSMLETLEVGRLPDHSEGSEADLQTSVQRLEDFLHSYPKEVESG